MNTCSYLLRQFTSCPPSSQSTTWEWPPWTWPPLRCSTSSAGTAAGFRARGRRAWSRTWPPPMAAWRWAFGCLTPSTSSSAWSRTHMAATCSTTASGPATAPAPTGPRRGPLPTSCRWCSAQPAASGPNAAGGTVAGTDSFTVATPAPVWTREPVGGA